MDDLRSRLANRVQLTSDDLKAYLEAVGGAFGANSDCAMLAKTYGAASESAEAVTVLQSLLALARSALKGRPTWRAFAEDDPRNGFGRDQSTVGRVGYCGAGRS